MAEPVSNQHEPFDLLIIGGGINGVGIARDAVGRGLSVLLCEQGDLGGATSSASSKLVHGGLRYLEQYRFRMVRESLAEREVLLAAAPHLVMPMRFVLPHVRSLRPKWMMKLGLFLYDHLARRATLPATETVNLPNHPAGNPLRQGPTTGFIYSDCWVDDNRLVILNALDAQARGACILTRCRFGAASAEAGRWRVTLEDTLTGDTAEVMARVVINTAGPWAGEIAHNVLGVETRYRSRLVKGSHIVVPRLDPPGDDPNAPRFAYTLQNADRRIVFVLPFERDYSLIGTTDIPFEGDPSNVQASDEEIRYLCDAANRYFQRKLSPTDVTWTYSGVRPLYDDGSKSESRITRDYQIEMHPGDAPALTVWGGKLTGYRPLAEAALDHLRDVFPALGDEWTASATLPGGNLSPAGVERFERMVTSLWSWLPREVALGYAGRYGSRIHNVMGNASSKDDMGRELSPGFYEREARFLVRDEWALTAEDLLWRRTKHGLKASEADIEGVRAWLDEHLQSIERPGIHAAASHVAQEGDR